MKRSIPLAILILGATLSLSSLSCSPSSKYTTENTNPSTPVLDSLFLSTKQDTLPAIAIRFHYPVDGKPAMLQLFRSLYDSTGFELVVRDIPRTTLEFRDATGYPKESATKSPYQPIRYQLRAVAPSDSISPLSITGTLYLMDTPPRIDSIKTTSGYPVVSYFIQGNWGVSRRIEIIKNDSIIAQKSYDVSLSDITTSEHFKEWPIDSLRSRSLRLHDNGVFGVRIIAEVNLGDKQIFGLATGKFRVNP